MGVADFLIVGAMKSGTTTLFHDMLTHRGVFMPADKEPSNLLFDEVLTPEGRRAYERVFEGARPNQKCGEASTAYTKLPRNTGVPERAMQVCGADLRIIYIVRDPLERTLSHYYHNVAYGDNPPEFRIAIDESPKLIEVSKYAWQIEQWIEKFGRESVLILIFEEYLRDREAGVRAAWTHLGLEPPPKVELREEGYNRGESRFRLNSLGENVRRSAAYRKLVKPLLNEDMLQKVKRMFGEPVPPRPPRPDESVLGIVRERLAEDQARFHEIMGRSEPIWPVKKSEAVDSN